ncbi:hypothetical protein GCM10007036_06560 [Alsobacter metallidurans]|uniref:Serine aminopeptidase S33 domain-containing protein n=1 Tax=Alsobacter metallidurans TaxID=340221 RepID=A0A917I4Y1_9HYPH|nr:alpha/beta hydrolase [Alsobacter metallidurans]GGH10181.1 hypothetical protein GCM10007036_06560 [Alsobacter metallidurans]
MLPLAFGSCAGWLHRPASAPSSRGVVLCAAHGFEEFGARHAWRLLADEIAAAGLPTLRFDYPGVADSLGRDSDPDRVAAWLKSIGDAVATLRREAGVREVYLVGLRLGALLAAHAAARKDISGLALLAPPLSGRAYGREITALSSLLAPPGVSSVVEDEAVDGVETAGFLLSSGTIDALKALDWRSAPASPGSRVLIAAENGAPSVAAALGSGGAVIEALAFEGQTALLRDPTTSLVPSRDWRALTAWLADGAGPATPRLPRIAPPALLAGDGFTEELVAFGPGRCLPGVLTQPRGPALGRPVLLVLNAGGNPHTGWARQTVDLCRKVALGGVAALRMDLLGLGDAPRPTDGRDRIHYADQSHEDVVAALDWLEARGFGPVTLAGQCSGAYRAFHTAVADPRVAGLVMLNNQIFSWREGQSLDAAMRDSYRATGFYLARIANREVWRRIVAGDVKVAGIAGELARRGWRAARARLARSRRAAGPNPVRGAFEALSERGCRVLLVYSEDDGGRDELARHIGPGGREAEALPGLSLRIIPGADHNLTPRHARETYARCVEEFLAGVEKAGAERSVAA